MKAIIKRPKGLKRPVPGLIDRDVLKVSKRSTIRFVPFGNGYPGVRVRGARDRAIGPAFKADVESLLAENAELLRRLAR